MTNPFCEKALSKIAKLEKWFSEEHDRIMKEHSKVDGIYAKCIEGYAGGHDHAWVKWEGFLADLGISFDEILKMRGGEAEKNHG